MSQLSEARDFIVAFDKIVSRFKDDPIYASALIQRTGGAHLMQLIYAEIEKFSRQSIHDALRSEGLDKEQRDFITYSVERLVRSVKLSDILRHIGRADRKLKDQINAKLDDDPILRDQWDGFLNLRHGATHGGEFEHIVYSDVKGYLKSVEKVFAIISEALRQKPV